MEEIEKKSPIEKSFQSRSDQIQVSTKTILYDDQNIIQSNGITAELLPLFQCLRGLGRCPLIFETIEDNQGFRQVHYKFKFCFKQEFLLSAFVALFVSLCCILQTIYRFSPTPVFGDLWPVVLPDQVAADYWKSVKPMPRIILNSFEIILIVMVIIEYIIIWRTAPMLAKWLNEWNGIDKDFKTYFGILYNPDLSKLRRKFAFPYVVIPTITFGSLISAFYIDLLHPFGIVVIITACFFPTACFQAEDAKIVIMFKTIKMSFKQIRQGVQMRHQKRSILKNKTLPMIGILGVEEIRGWHIILIKIRKQAETIGKYLAIHQLISIASLLYFASSALYMLSNILGQQEDHGLFVSMPVIIVFTLITNARLFVKIVSAVRITEEEKQLAYVLKDLEFMEYDLECKQEVKEIHEMLVQYPTEISLNNYVSLNNSLMLSIFGQVLTQFIVFQNFQNSF